MDSTFTSNELDFHKFYELSDPLANRPLRLRLTTESQWLSVEQQVMLSKGRLTLEAPLKLEAFMGGQAADFLWSGHITLVCVSSRVIDLLRNYDCTGWSTYPVEVYDRKGDLLPDYHGFAITGPECKRDKSRSQIIEKPIPGLPERRTKVYKGLYFHEKCWDGSDFFWIHYLNAKIITEKVYRLFKENKVRNIRMIPLPEVERDVLLDRYEK